jgi:acyl carrier protein
MVQEIESIIQGAAREVAEQEGQSLPSDLGQDTPLFGKDGLFDSLGLVTLIVAVEEAIAERYGLEVSLADEQALSQSRSPFRSIGSLAEYAHGLIAKSDG